jgi:hypothetical protein
VLPLQLVLAVLVLGLCAFSPGFFIVRRFRVNPLEKLCASVALSLILLFLAAWLVYVAALPWTPASIVISLASAALLAVSFGDARRLFANARVRQVTAAFGFLFLWTLVLLATIRNYSGAGWGGDWLEHFQRTLVYLHRLPVQTEILGGYRIPSRPPLANSVAAFVMAQAGDSFEVFQIVFAFLNLLPFLPCCLMLPLVARPWKFGVFPLTVIYALSPVMMVNGTYTGVKTVTAFFAVTAVAFYLRGLRKNDLLRVSLAFLTVAAAALAHYSGLPYAIFLGLHYLIAVLPRRRNWKELACLATAAAIPLFAWFGWCVAHFGIPGTFNDVVHASIGYHRETYEGSFFVKCLANLFDSLVPHPLRDWSLVQAWGQPNTLGYVRDNLFLVYQSNLVFTMGVIGGPIAYWFLFRALRRSTGFERNFWLAFLPASVVICFIVAGERDPFGVAHLTLISVIAIGLASLAGNFTRHRVVSMLLVAGCAIDFSFGIYLHVRIEHLENTATSTPYTRVHFGTSMIDLLPANPDTLSSVTANNWFTKHRYAFSEKLLPAFDAAKPAGRDLAPSQQAVHDLFAGVIRQDDTMFGGWYKRHHGETTFFGDHFGDSDFTSWLLVAGAAAMLWKLARYAPPVAAVAVPKSSPTRRRKK